MGLQVWLPLIDDISNKGKGNISFSNISTSNTTLTVNGKIGSCYTNNSHTAGGLVSTSTIYLGQQQSMFCWFKFTDLMSGSNLGGNLISQHRYASNCGLGISLRYASATTGYLSVNTGDGTSRTYNTYFHPTLLQANTWYHGGFTYDNGKLKLYVNGVCGYENNIGIQSTPSDYLTVFAWSTSGTSGNGVYGDYKLIGSLNDVRVYNHCLTQKEISNLYNLTEGSGLILHYPLNHQGLNNNHPNLLMNTYNMPVESTTKKGFRLSGAGTITHINYDNLPVGDGVIRLTNNTSAAAWGGIAQDSLDGFVAGQKYSQSCWVRASTTITDFKLEPIWISSSQTTGIETTGHTINTQWQYVKWEGVVLSGTQSTINPGGYSAGYAYATIPAGGWFEICGMKVEYGEEATSWSPHLLDEFNKNMKYDTSIYTEPDGSKWVRVVHHNNPSSSLFSSTDTFAQGVYKDANRWYNLETMCEKVHKYEFMVKQKTTSSATETKYRWIQYKNPILATWTDVQPTAVSRITTSGYTNGGQGGIFLSTANTRARIANASSGDWFGALGAWSVWQGGIPGYPNTGITTGYIDLYMRIDGAIEEFIEYDISGCGNHGERVGYFSWSSNTPIYNASTEFNGGNYIRVQPEKYIVQKARAMTWSIWAYNDDWTVYNGRIYSCTEAGGVNIETDNNHNLAWAVNVFWGNYSYTGTCYVLDSSLSPGWHMFTWVYIIHDGAELFIDGKYNTGNTIRTDGIHFAYVPLFLGAEAGSTETPAGTYLTGKLSDFRVYNRALTGREILSLYNNGAYVDDNNVIHGQVRDLT